MDVAIFTTRKQMINIIGSAFPFVALTHILVWLQRFLEILGNIALFMSGPPFVL